MASGDRKGGGLMTETLERERSDTASDASRPALPRALSSATTGKNASRLGFVASFRSALDERRLFALIPFAMIGGLIVAVDMPEDPSVILLAVGGAALAAALVLARRSLTAVRLLVLAGAVWCGFSLLAIHGALFGTPMLSRAAYGGYSARVDEVLSATPDEQRIIVSAIIPTGKDRAVPMRRARLLVKQGPTLSPGDTIAGDFRFAPVPGPVHPGAFDSQFHGYFDGIGAYGNTVRPPVLATPGDDTSPERILDAIRRGISSRIDAALQQPAAGVGRAIINGDQSAVTVEARQIMATAGIAHVLSVSGLHLTLVAGGAYWVLRLLLAGFEGVGRFVSVKRIAAVGGMASAVFYYLISGGNVAALRSTLMILLVFGAVLAGRRALTMRNVAIAAIIVIATDPASVFRPSFQLSFSAVVALIGAYEVLRSSSSRDAGIVTKVLAYTKGVVITSLVAGAATLLFSIYHFQQTSPLGVLGNLGTLPLVGFIMMPAAAVAVLAMPLGIEGPFLFAMGWSIDRMLEMAAIVADLSTHLRASPLLTPTALVIGLAGLAWFAFFRDRWRLVGPVAGFLAVLCFTIDRPPDVLIADTTKAIAIRGPEGLALADGKTKSFALDIWRATYAEPIAVVADKSCDSIACVGESSAGFSWALITDPAGFAEECGEADLIVTRGPAPDWCRAGAVIDETILGNSGVEWLRWDNNAGRFEIRPAIVNLARSWRIRTGRVRP
jgi:competence protein ComEC